MSEAIESPRAGDGKTLAVPFGMALVPLQATFKMVSAFHEVTDQDQLVHGNCQSRWRAMLAAAPTVAPLTLETAEEARKDRAHAEAYFRQAEQLLTANEQTLRAERDQLLEQLAAAQREVIELRAAAPAVPAPAWQPIETAPTGQRALLWAPGWTAPVVDDWGKYSAYNHPKFTHWMPLPPLPAPDSPSPATGEHP